MLKSMTGFGRSFLETKYGRLIVEIQAVNKKFLETAVFLPKELFSLEVIVKQWLAKQICRGQVTVRIFLLPDEKHPSSFLPNSTLLKHLKNEWVKIAENLELDKDQIDLSFLLQQSRLFTSFEQNIEEIKKDLKNALDEAIDAFNKMREKEGYFLLKDIDKRRENLLSYIEKIKNKAPIDKEQYRKRLQEKVFLLLPSFDGNDEKVIRDIIVYADKVDITEEIVRLLSHLKQFHELLKTSSPIGRKADFILQEMHREIHTIGAKAVDIEIVNMVVVLKSELEKIREQVQNIE